MRQRRPGLSTSSSAPGSTCCAEQIAFASSVGSDAPPLLLAAAKRLERLDVELARETYLDAWGAALFAGRMATAGSLLEVSRAARAAPRASHPPRPSDLLLDGLALLITEGRAAAAPMLRQATMAFAADEVAAEDNFRWGWLTTVPSNVLWDDDNWHAINVRQLQLARDAGALARLPIDLTALAILVAWWGDLRERCGCDRGGSRRSPRRPRPGSRPSAPCCSPRSGDVRPRPPP